MSEDNDPQSYIGYSIKVGLSRGILVPRVDLIKRLSQGSLGDASDEVRNLLVLKSRPEIYAYEEAALEELLRSYETLFQEDVKLYVIRKYLWPRTDNEEVKGQINYIAVYPEEIIEVILERVAGSINSRVQRMTAGYLYPKRILECAVENLTDHIIIRIPHKDPDFLESAQLRSYRPSSYIRARVLFTKGCLNIFNEGVYDANKETILDSPIVSFVPHHQAQT